MRTAILPFVFIFNPEMLLIGVESWAHTAVVIVASIPVCDPPVRRREHELFCDAKPSIGRAQLLLLLRVLRCFVRTGG